jgi:hypothetical protein
LIDSRNGILTGRYIKQKNNISLTLLVGYQHNDGMMNLIYLFLQKKNTKKRLKKT